MAKWDSLIICIAIFMLGLLLLPIIVVVGNNIIYEVRYNDTNNVGEYKIINANEPIRPSDSANKATRNVTVHYNVPYNTNITTLPPILLIPPSQLEQEKVEITEPPKPNNGVPSTSEQQQNNKSTTDYSNLIIITFGIIAGFLLTSIYQKYRKSNEPKTGSK